MRRARRGPVAGLLLLVLAAATLEGQHAPRLIEGRVVRPGDSAPVPVRDAWVVLHRVGADTAGPLDSMRTRADGGYRFRYTPSGDTLAVYFVATNRGGVAYFTSPVRDVVTRGAGAELLVFDTTSAAIPITVRGRHVIVTAGERVSAEGRRTIIEAYELSNDSTVTRVARGDDGVTFDVPLPAGASSVTASQGDVSAEAVRTEDGRVRVNAPLAPGLKQLSFSYEVPAAVPTEFLVESPVPVLEVLVEDPRGVAVGAGLVAVDPVEIEGRPFRRFLAQDVAAAQTFSVRVPGAESAVGLRVMLVVTAVGAAMLLGLGMTFLRKGPAGFARRRVDDPEGLARAVAALDAAYERLESPTKQQQAEHHVARARLKGRLTAALAKQDGLQ